MSAIGRRVRPKYGERRKPFYTVVSYSEKRTGRVRKRNEVVCLENNAYFLEKAQSLFPKLIQTEVYPKEKSQEPLNLEIFAKTDPRKPLGSGESLLLDFGNHQVGYLRLTLGSVGSHPDAPVWLRVRFAERLQELKEEVSAYHGWISKGWIQSEEIHIDVLPAKVQLPRRYAFRYVLIEVLDVSGKFRLTVDEVSCTAVSSADDTRLIPYESVVANDALLDRIACRTLHDCMQTVFEDGPKRDRRLWLGDLRLQALANYETYRQYDMVKSCLYLFAGSMLPGGRVSACIFLDPKIEADDTVMFDYSLFFIATLRDYYKETDDLETLRELYPTAYRQWELAQEDFDETGIVQDSDVMGWCFVDWDLHLNKQASAQGIYLYCTRALTELARDLGLDEQIQILEQDIKQKTGAARKQLFDRDRGVYVSGASRQISYASQAWMVLGGVADGLVLDRVEQIAEAHSMVTPYMYHQYVDALIHAEKREKAFDVLRKYWGGMAEAGADTFWELYNPDNPQESPYGGSIVHSFCHAWSCGPAYFLRKYGER